MSPSAVSTTLYLAQVAIEHPAVLSSFTAPQDPLGYRRSFSTVSEVPLIPRVLSALRVFAPLNTNAGPGFLAATCYCTGWSVLSQALVAKKL